MATQMFVLLICLGIAGFIFWLKKRRKKSTGKTPYVDALHLLLEGKSDNAMEQLKRTINEDSDNIMAYITLGDIFRNKGFPLRAAKVHRNLLLRNTLTEIQTDAVLHHLVLDYRTAGTPDKAVEMAERLTQRNKKNVDFKRLLLTLYEEKRDWDKAYFLRQSLNKWLKRRDHHILALYRVQSGMDLTQRGAEHEARIRFREAIKLDKRCIPAHLYWGDSYRREGRNEDAYGVWYNFTKENPEWAHLAFDRLNGALYDLGRYSEMENIYQDVISKKPKDPTAYLHLINIFKKQGKLDEALDLCSQIGEVHPESARCRLMYVQLLQIKGSEGKAMEEALHYLQDDTEKREAYVCNACGHESREPLWRCPQCNQWNTYLDAK